MQFVKIKPETKDAWEKTKYIHFKSIKHLHIGCIVYTLSFLNHDNLLAEDCTDSDSCTWETFHHI